MRMNPVLDRELRERVRGARSGVLVTLYLVLLGAFFLLTLYASIESGSRGGGLQATDVARVGRSCFEWLIFFMLIFVMFLVPGLTSSAVAGERERQTLVPMQVTLLRPRNIIAGKVQASMAFLLLLIVAALPLVSICYAIGGLSVVDAVLGLVAVAFTGLVMACIATGCSAIAKRTQTATLLAYFLTLCLNIGTFMVWGIAGSFTQSEPPVLLLTLNPFMNASALAGGKASNLLDINGPLTGMRAIVQQSGRSNSFGSGSSQSIGAITPSNDVFNFAVGSTLVLITVAMLAVWFASTKLRTPAERER